MKNKILIPAILLSFFFTGCFTDVPGNLEKTNEDETYLSFNSTPITVVRATGTSANESITLNSLRVLVFSDREDDRGDIITNRYFAISNTQISRDATTGSWMVDFSNILVPTRPGPSIVYVVLNEDVGVVSGQSLTAALEGISNIGEMHTLVNTPLGYTPIRVTYNTETGLPVEPPFIMVTYDNFDIEPNRHADNPFMADLRGPSDSSNGFAMDRTMAKVTIENVTNRSMDGTPVLDDQKLATSYVFINKMGLINVTKQYMWSPNRFPVEDPLTPDNPYPAPIPSYDTNLGYHTIDFGLENAELFYERTWDGSISAHITANVTWRQYGTGNIYKVSNSAGVNSYGTGNPYPFDYGTTPNVNEGNFRNYLLTYFESGMGGGFDTGNITYTNPVITPQVTGGYWDINERNISYYVPEHILSTNTDPTNATKLYVKASVARLPYINEIEFSYNQDDVQWTMEGGDIKWYYPPINEMLNGQSLTSLFQVAPHPTVSGKYMHFIPGSFAWREATGTINMNVTGLQFVQSEGGSSQEFYLPIRNAPESPNDYNIYRNHEYKFSVHVLNLWPRAQATRSAVSKGLEGGCMVLRYNDN